MSQVTLRGLVLPVGGVKEKVIGAHRAGVRMCAPAWAAPPATPCARLQPRLQSGALRLQPYVPTLQTLCASCSNRMPCTCHATCHATCHVTCHATCHATPSRCILPARNEKDLLELPASVAAEMEFTFVSDVEQVMCS